MPLGKLASEELMKLKNIVVDRRKKRIRSKIRQRKLRPRLSVYRSDKFIYAQIIDDTKQVTLVAASNKDLKEDNNKINKNQRAKLVGELLGKKALKKGLKKVVFDRGHYRYHGRIKALAEGAKKSGLQF